MIISPFGYQKVFYGNYPHPPNLPSHWHLLAFHDPCKPFSSFFPSHITPTTTHTSTFRCIPRFVTPSISRPSVPPLVPCRSVFSRCTGSTQKTVSIFFSPPSLFDYPVPCLYVYKIKLSPTPEQIKVWNLFQGCRRKRFIVDEREHDLFAQALFDVAANHPSIPFLQLNPSTIPYQTVDIQCYRFPPVCAVLLSEHTDYVCIVYNILTSGHPYCTRGDGRSPLSGFGIFRSLHTALLTCSCPRILTMEVMPQRPKDREGVISTLNAAIEAVNLEKEISAIMPAGVAFGSGSVLLAMIRIHFLLFRNDLLQVHTYPGFNDQRNGSCRAWAVLRQYLSSA